MPYRLCKCLGDRRGVVSIEFALLMPVLLTMLLSAVEIGRFLVLDMKLETGAAKMADLMTRERSPTTGQLSDAFHAVPSMLRPFGAGPRSRVIVSGVVRVTDEDPPEVAWQISGGGSLSASSLLGGEGDTADVPDGLTVAGRDAVIVAEMVYEYDAWLLGVIDDQRIRKTAFFRPRLSSMRSLD